MSEARARATRADPDRGAGLYYASSTLVPGGTSPNASFSIHDPGGIMVLAGGLIAAEGAILRRRPGSIARRDNDMDLNASGLPLWR